MKKSLPGGGKRARHWALFRYTLALGYPVEGKRHGLILRREDSDCRFSEISPFPSLNVESLEEASCQVQQLLHGEHPSPLLPSVRFGMEGQEVGPPFSVPISALFVGSVEEMLQQAEKSTGCGFRCAKVKIGDLGFEEALFILRGLQGKFSLRVDLNRKWPLQQAVELFSHFPLETFDYIEEPAPTFAELADFPFPFAVDESLPELLAGRPLPRHLKALIVKPMRFGGLSECKKILAFARRHGLQMVLSSTFESGVGLIQIAKIAGALQLDQYPHGLGTYAFLKEDVLEDPLRVEGGRLLCEAVRVKQECLEEIAHGSF